MKILLISGSPRKGNTEFILSKISEGLKADNELILLRNKKINYCQGCGACFETNECLQNDDMSEIISKMTEADLVILGTPNYYDNVSALTKNFFDRTSPFYEGSKLENKKFIAIISAYQKGESVDNCETAIRNYAKTQKIDVLDVFSFQAEAANDVANNPESLKNLELIIEKINSLG